MIRAMMLSAVLVLTACSPGPEAGSPVDDRLVVLGPSLVETMCAAGLEDRIVGVDRYAAWPPSVRSIPDVGGYSDPSLEVITGLSPTSIHIVGHNAALSDLAALLGIPLHSYRFDTLDDVMASADTIHRLYGGEALPLAVMIEEALDSIALSREGLEPMSALIVVYHEPGSSSMTVAGRGTFFDDVLARIGCSIAAPDGAGPWPAVSVEGVLDLSPDRIICMYPDAPDTLGTARAESTFWSGLGYGPPRVRCLFDSFLLVPGARIAETAGRINQCLR
jgi:iron complex transport system substrate-binding protein